MNLRQRDRKFLGRESDAGDLEVARTNGSHLFDARGRRYIDFVAGWCVGNFGWGNERIRRRIARARVPDYVYPEYLYKSWVELAELLASIAPGKLQKTYRATGGTEAVDIALQIAMASTKRRRFITVEGSYHGNSIGTVSIASTENREPYPNRLTGCLTIKPPLDERAAERVERMLRRRDVAALIMEPISCNLGILMPAPEFMTRVAKLCRRYGTLLVMDEVATGFGRTGVLFATEHFDIEPDILCLAKAITGGYAPMGATMTTAKIAGAIRGDVGFYSTYGWHPLAVEIAIDNIRWIIRHRRKLLEHVAEMSDLFGERLARMKFKPPAKLRIKGLAIGVETGDENYVSKIAEKCRRKGLLLTTAGNVLTMFPALTIDAAVAEEGLEILRGTVN